jgi:hypothetical protein
MKLALLFITQEDKLGMYFFTEAFFTRSQQWDQLI